MLPFFAYWGDWDWSWYKWIILFVKVHKFWLNIFGRECILRWNFVANICTVYVWYTILSSFNIVIAAHLSCMSTIAWKNWFRFTLIFKYMMDVWIKWWCYRNKDVPPKIKCWNESGNFYMGLIINDLTIVDMLLYIVLYYQVLQKVISYCHYFVVTYNGQK